MKKAISIIMLLVMVVTLLVGINVAKEVKADGTPVISEGTNVAETGTWSSFSVCTREDGGVWEDALKGIRSDTYPNGMVKGVDYATEGYVTNKCTPNFMEFYIKNTGWDAEYDPNGNIVADNPYGLWAQRENIPIEHGRTYTVSFKIKSTLYKPGHVDEYMGEIIPEVKTKHVTLEAISPDSKSYEKVKFDSISGANASPSGMLELVDNEEQEVKATITIPADRKLYNSDEINFRFVAGSHIVTYRKEIAMSGYIYVSDFKVIAEDKWDLPIPPYNEVTTIKESTVKKPAKVKIGKVSSPAKKKLSVKWKKIKKISGYEMYISSKKNFKSYTFKRTYKAKTIKTTIIGLKSKKKYFVKIRAYKKIDKKKYYGAWSKVKKVKIK